MSSVYVSIQCYIESNFSRCLVCLCILFFAQVPMIYFLFLKCYISYVPSVFLLSCFLLIGAVSFKLGYEKVVLKTFLTKTTSLYLETISIALIYFKICLCKCFFQDAFNS